MRGGGDTSGSNGLRVAPLPGDDPARWTLMTRRHWILMWALALVWGASYLFIKVGLEAVEPVFLVWIRLALAGLVLLPLAVRSGALAGLGEDRKKGG